MPRVAFICACYIRSTEGVNVFRYRIIGGIVGILLISITAQPLNATESRIPLDEWLDVKFDPAGVVNFVSPTTGLPIPVRVTRFLEDGTRLDDGLQTTLTSPTDGRVRYLLTPAVTLSDSDTTAAHLVLPEPIKHVEHEYGVTVSAPSIGYVSDGLTTILFWAPVEGIDTWHVYRDSTAVGTAPVASSSYRDTVATFSPDATRYEFRSEPEGLYATEDGDGGNIPEGAQLVSSSVDVMGAHQPYVMYEPYSGPDMDAPETDSVTGVELVDDIIFYATGQNLPFKSRVVFKSFIALPRVKSGFSGSAGGITVDVAPCGPSDRWYRGDARGAAIDDPAFRTRFFHELRWDGGTNYSEKLANPTIQEVADPTAPGGFRETARATASVANVNGTNLGQTITRHGYILNMYEHESGNPFCETIATFGYPDISGRIDRSTYYRDGGWSSSGFNDRFPSYEVYRHAYRSGSRSSAFVHIYNEEMSLCLYDSPALINAVCDVTWVAVR